MLGVGFSHWSAVGPLAHSSAARNVIVAVVLFLMSLPLETSAVVLTRSHLRRVPVNIPPSSWRRWTRETARFCDSPKSFFK